MNPDDLRAILRRLESASGPDRDLDAALQWALVGRYLDTDPSYHPLFDVDAAKAWDEIIGRGWRNSEGPVPHLTASLDVAVVLVERVLPGAAVLICRVPGDFEPICTAKVSMTSLHDGDGSDAVHEYMALALCTALVRALLERSNA